MDLNLQIKPRTEDSVVASYSCPCGCNPRLPYQRGVEHAADGCCCGNQFAVGPGADAALEPPEGYQKEIQGFDAPWGERIPAVWTIGPSTDPNASRQDASGHGHEDAHDHGRAEAQGGGASVGASGVDPVCGMTVAADAARAKGLHSRHEETDYSFCSPGCKRQFDDAPGRYLNPSQLPSM